MEVLDSGKKFKVLVVEDEEMTKRLVVSVLNKRTCVIEEAEDGKEALKVLEEFEPDIIITDVVMPNMDGFDFYRALKANIRTFNIPVVGDNPSVTLEMVSQLKKVNSSGYSINKLDELNNVIKENFPDIVIIEIGMEGKSIRELVDFI